MFILSHFLLNVMKKLPVATDSQFEPSDIPPSEYPDIQTDDADQSWGLRYVLTG
jgi:hypothetical protein